jgi:AcrR family transcriptional regulator
LTKGGIYFHFKNKDALLKEILEEYERTYLDKMIEVVRSTEGKAVDKLEHLLRFSLNFSAENREICLCLTSLATELCSSKKKYENEIKKIYEKYRKFLVNLFEEGREDGSFREDIIPDVLSLNFIGANEGNLFQWNMNRGDNPGNFSKEFSRSYMKFLLNGICKPKINYSNTVDSI